MKRQLGTKSDCSHVIILESWLASCQPSVSKRVYSCSHKCNGWLLKCFKKTSLFYENVLRGITIKTTHTSLVLNISGLSRIFIKKMGTLSTLFCYLAPVLPMLEIFFLFYNMKCCRSTFVVSSEKNIVNNDQSSSV